MAPDAQDTIAVYATFLHLKQVRYSQDKDAWKAVRTLIRAGLVVDPENAERALSLSNVLEQKQVTQLDHLQTLVEQEVARGAQLD